MRITLPVLLVLPACVWVTPAVAQSAGGALARDEMIEAREDVLYRVGRLEGAPWETFGEFLELGFDAAGRLYVLDRDNRLLHSYTEGGRHRWTAGGGGGGPGEFGTPTRLAVLPDGRTVVADLGHRGLLLFDSTGSYLTRLAMPEGLLAGAIHPAGEDEIYFLPVSSMVRADSLPIFRMGLDGSERVIAHVPSRGPRVVRTAAGLQRTLPPTFSPSLETTALGGELAVVEDARYVIEVLGNARPAVLRRAVAPRPVTQADRAAAREDARRRAAQTRARAVGGFRVLPSSPDAIEARIRAMTFADTLPAVQAMRGSPDGDLWVARSGPVALQPGPIDVFERGGGYQGTLSGHRLPDALGPAGAAAWVEIDDLGVPSIRVARVQLRARPD